jgi:dihydroorotate dehydrogenase (NAD+) catalytic subunit
MAVDVEARRPVLANVTGGLSGPAIRPIAVYMVQRVYAEVAREAGVPIIGMGGIQFAGDAIEFLLAGATAVGVGTALFVDPGCLLEILDGIEGYLRRHGHGSVREVIGGLETN